jgi:hypothetical protein
MQPRCATFAPAEARFIADACAKDSDPKSETQTPDMQTPPEP